MRVIIDVKESFGCYEMKKFLDTLSYDEELIESIKFEQR